MQTQKCEGLAGQRDALLVPADLRLREQSIAALAAHGHDSASGETGLVEIYAPGTGRACLIHPHASYGTPEPALAGQIDWLWAAGIRVIQCRSVAAAITAAAAVSQPVRRTRREGRGQ